MVERTGDGSNVVYHAGYLFSAFYSAVPYYYDDGEFTISHQRKMQSDAIQSILQSIEFI